jgi:hypothetical protein
MPELISAPQPEDPKAASVVPAVGELPSPQPEVVEQQSSVDIYAPLHALGVEITSKRMLNPDERVQVVGTVEAWAEPQPSVEAYGRNIDQLSSLLGSLIEIEEYEIAERVNDAIKASNARRSNLDRAREGSRLPEQKAYSVAAEAGPGLDAAREAQATKAESERKVTEARTRLGKVIAEMNVAAATDRAGAADRRFQNTIKSAERSFDQSQP